MNKFWIRVRQFFCFHKWDCIAGFEIYDIKPVMFRCLKCGKEEGL